MFRELRLHLIPEFAPSDSALQLRRTVATLRVTYTSSRAFSPVNRRAVGRFGTKRQESTTTRTRLQLLWFLAAILFFVAAMQSALNSAVYIALGVVFLTLGATSRGKRPWN